MGVVNFFKDGCGGGCGQAKKASTGCGQPLDGCGTTPSHTHIVPPCIKGFSLVKMFSPKTYSSSILCAVMPVVHDQMVITITAYKGIWPIERTMRYCINMRLYDPHVLLENITFTAHCCDIYSPRERTDRASMALEI